MSAQSLQNMSIKGIFYVKSLHPPARGLCLYAAGFMTGLYAEHRVAACVRAI